MEATANVTSQRTRATERKSAVNPLVALRERRKALFPMWSVTELLNGGE